MKKIYMVNVSCGRYFLSTDKLRLYVLRMNMYEYGYGILKKKICPFKKPAHRVWVEEKNEG
jgi:hypothetical protein